MLEGAQKASQTVTADGDLVRTGLIDGLKFKDVRNVLARNGVVTELWRPEWPGEDIRPAHIVYVTLAASGVTNWHCHKLQTDLLFVVRGMISIAFYDDRENSPTYRRMNVFPFSHLRPTLIQIPTSVWHALKNIGTEEAAYVTMNDRAFCYEDPDDWRLPPGSDALPRPF